MSLQAKNRPEIITAAITLIFTLASIVPGRADEGCFIERGRRLQANISHVAVSGRLVASLQRSGWGVRPGLRITEVDVSGPIEIGSWLASWGVSDVHMTPTTAFVAAVDGLHAIDLRNPTNPAVIGSTERMDSEHLAIDDDYAYIATTGVGGNGWFEIVDISDPGSMERVGQLYWDRPDPFKLAVAAAGEMAVIADFDGVLVIDVSIPSHPEEMARWPRNGARDVAFVDSFAVVGITSWVDPDDVGIEVVDLSQPSTPTLAGTWHAPSSVLSVAEYGGDVVVGTADDGLFLVDIGNPVNPIVVDHWHEPGLRVEDLSTAWPTIALSDFHYGTVILGLHRSCIPPRHPSDRVVGN